METTLSRRKLLCGLSVMPLLLVACGAPPPSAPTAVPRPTTSAPTPAPSVAPTSVPAPTTGATTAATPTSAASPQAFVSTAGTPMPTVVAHPGAALKGTLEVYPDQFLPNVPRGEGTKPLVEPQKIADAWAAQHPGSQVKWREGPPQGQQSDEWALAQIIGGTAPDIMPQGLGEFQAQSELKAWFVDLEPALKQSNPYVKAGDPGSSAWEDLFYSQAWLQRGTSTGKRTYLPLDLDTTGFYYNQTIFDKVGVKFAEVKDFAEMLDAFQKVKQAGYIPTLMNFSAASNQTWWLRLIRSQVNTDLLYSTIDVNHDQNVTQAEWSNALQSGTWDATKDYWWEAWRILRLVEPFQQQGYMASYDFTLFTSGKVATVFDGNWDLTKIADDPRRQFDYGVRNVPPVSKKTSPMAPDNPDPNAVRTLGGGFGNTLAITSLAVTRGNGELALDFCQWFTAPQNFGPMSTELSGRTPNIKNIQLTPRMAPFAKMSKDTAEYADPWTKLVDSFRAGMVKFAQQLYSKQIDEKAFQQQVQTAQVAAAKELCGKFKWTFCK